jgi:hypothetical protein
MNSSAGFGIDFAQIAKRRIQFVSTSAPIIPHSMHSMRAPNDGTVRSPVRPTSPGVDYRTRLERAHPF